MARKKTAAGDTRVAIAGSDRGVPLHGAEPAGDVPASERFEVTIRVRRGSPIAGPLTAAAKADPAARRFLTREDYVRDHGASEADLAAVAAFARAHDLTVVETSAARRSVFVSGTAAAYAAAFGTSIAEYEHDGGSYRGRTGTLSVPADVAPLIEGVFGIDDRPIATPHFQRQAPVAGMGIAAHAAATSFTPIEIARLYDFPADADGSGECIGLIELGGGYRKADIKAYFAKLGLAAPKVVSVRVDGGRNAPSTADSADGEVMLDILVAGAVAPRAKIVVYFAPNTDKGFIDALTRAVHDTTHKPSVISISWGSAEANWTGQALTSFDAALQTAATLGVTVCAAAGDNGSADAVSDGKAHVDFPASSPHMLACGGTRLTGSDGAITAESVWNVSTSSATGGGISDVFAVPDYQRAVTLPASANGAAHKGRGLPDVAGDADPSTGYQVRVDGQEFVIGGTSAVAPLWAGLIALINQQAGKPVGFLNPTIYAGSVGQGFNDVTSGSNGAYQATRGWDACTGWGSPSGTALLARLRG